MIIDAQAQLSASQAVTADAYSTNTYDMATAGDDISRGEPLAILVSVETAADYTTTDETYSFLVVQSANANLSSHDTLSTITIAASALTAGSLHVLPIPPGAVTKRYLGLRYDVGGTTPSVTCDAWVAPMSMIANWTAHADNITIS